MELMVMSTISVFSACDMVTGNAPSPLKAFSHFCCINIASFFTFHNPKSLTLVNFSISHFELMVLDYPLTLPHGGRQLFRIRRKITPITNLICGASDNQATKSVWNNYKHKPKVENRERKERENTKEFVYPVRSKLTYYGGESSPPFHYNDK